jgi:light-harvesting complex I chlorophyll a/b binding protein 1
MLAALGFIAGEAVEDKTLFYNWDGGISGPAIVHFQQTKQGFWEPLVLVIGIAEAFRVAIHPVDPTPEGYQPGDLGFDPLGLCPTDKAEFDVLQTKELNNGRLAMIGMAGIIVQELITNKPIFG